MSVSSLKSQIEESQLDQQETGTSALVFSANDFASLEERILRTIEVVKRERQSRVAAEDRASHAEARAAEQESLVEQLNQEVRSLRAERDHVRQRVERLLAQLDALEV
ncbi:MAG TPA: hypothetical protein VKR52_18020 [Terracidiphilus sp.]|nr:hypothetical protein [Terracidiphilus sp.]